MIKEESETREGPARTGEKLLPAPPIHNEPPARPKSMNGIVTSGLTSTDPSAPLLLAGLSLPLPGLVAMLTDFARHLSLTLPPTPGGDRAVSKEEELRSRTRTTLFGTFDESFSGAEFVDWLLNKVRMVRTSSHETMVLTISRCSWKASPVREIGLRRRDLSSCDGALSVVSVWAKVGTAAGKRTMCSKIP